MTLRKVGRVGTLVGALILGALALAMCDLVIAGSARVAAHRGGAALWPENSLLAFRNALGLGADYLETDVHLTADGDVVVVHDPTLERTTTGRGPVRATPTADLAAVRLRAADGTVTDEPVPTLAALLELLAPSRAELLLEIKVDAERRRYPGIEEKVLALLDRHRLADRVLVMAFEADTIRRVRELEPAQRTVLLVSQRRAQNARTGDVITWARDARATVLGIDHRALDAALLFAARAAGLQVAAWTVNEEADIRRVLALGVDVVISDRPDVARRLAGNAR